MVSVVQTPAAICSDRDDVLDKHAEPPGQIQSPAPLKGNVTVYGLGDDEDLIINGIGNFRHIPCARRRHLDEDLQRPSLDDEQELTDGPHARPAHTIADEVGAGAVLQCGRAY